MDLNRPQKRERKEGSVRRLWQGAVAAQSKEENDGGGSGGGLRCKEVRRGTRGGARKKGKTRLQSAKSGVREG